jgi:hypothetical protein
MSQAKGTWPSGNIQAAPAGPGLDVVARAEAALKALAGQFARWLQDEIDKLDAARARVAAEGLSGEAGEALYMHAHDLKGLGGTYEFPIVTQMAGSLCDLLEDPMRRPGVSIALIDVHLDTIKAAVQGGIRDGDHPIGHAMLVALEDQVRAAD